MDKEGKTCRRCADTGTNIKKAIEALRTELNSVGVNIEFREIKLPPDRISESNEILLNGDPLESFIADAKTGENECKSCSNLLGKSASCRTVCCGEAVFEDVPEDIIRQAVINWLNKSNI